MSNFADELRAVAAKEAEAQGLNLEGGEAQPVQTVPAVEPVEPIPTEPVAEQPIVQPVAEPATEPVATEAEPEPAAPEPVQFTFGDKATEPIQTNEKYQEQLEVALKELKELKERGSEGVFASDESQAINEYIRGGGKLDSNFWEMQNKDYDNVDFSSEKDMLSILKDKYRFEGFDEADTNRILTKNYPSLFKKDEYEEGEIADARMDLKIAARQALPQLQEKKKSAMLPKADPQAVQKQQESLKMYQAEASVALSKIDSFEFNLSDDFPIKANIDADSRRQIGNLILNPENQAQYFVNNYANEDGTVNFESFARDEYFRIHRESLLKAAFDQGKSLGSKETIQSELQQETPSGERKKSGTTAGGDSWKTSAKAGLARL